mgnify:CR=1 FL=1
MDNEIIEQKSFWTKRWFWSTVIIAIGFMLIMISNSDDVVNFGQAYADPSLYQNAIDKANKNEKVIQNFGKLKPIDKLAILEGNTLYSNNNKSISISVRVSGKKENGKMDILADKEGHIWKYKSIKIRNKKTNTMIDVNK